MSTMCEQFEAWFNPAAAACKAYDRDYSWKVWQAATEAKAGGVAGELPPLPLGIGAGSFFTADQMLAYGQARADAAELYMRMAMREATECAAEWKAKAEAARQPAPVVLNDGQIITMAKKFGDLWGMSDDAWIIDFARAIIEAATNRSKP